MDRCRHCLSELQAGAGDLCTRCAAITVYRPARYIRQLDGTYRSLPPEEWHPLTDGWGALSSVEVR